MAKALLSQLFFSKNGFCELAEVRFAGQIEPVLSSLDSGPSSLRGGLFSHPGVRTAPNPACANSIRPLLRYFEPFSNGFSRIESASELFSREYLAQTPPYRLLPARPEFAYFAYLAVRSPRFQPCCHLARPMCRACPRSALKPCGDPGEHGRQSTLPRNTRPAAAKGDIGFSEKLLLLQRLSVARGRSDPPLVETGSYGVFRCRRLALPVSVIGLNQRNPGNRTKSVSAVCSTAS